MSESKTVAEIIAEVKEVTKLFDARIGNPENQKALREAVLKYSPKSIDDFNEAMKLYDKFIDENTLREIAAMLLKIKSANQNFGDILNDRIFAPENKPKIDTHILCKPDYYDNCVPKKQGEAGEFINTHPGPNGKITLAQVIGGRKHKTKKHKKKGKKKTMRKKGKKKTKKRKGKKKMKKRGKKKTMKKRGKKSRK